MRLATAVIAVAVAGMAVPMEQDPGGVGGGGLATGSRTVAMEVGDPSPGGDGLATGSRIVATDQDPSGRGGGGLIAKPDVMVDQDPQDNLPTQ